MSTPSLLLRVRNYLEFIKFSHTIFALPFALISALVAAKGLPKWTTIGWILFCMITARTAAMSFNRWSDWHFDLQNPRTQNRSRLATRTAAAVICLLALGLFIIGAGKLNGLCLNLAPLAVLLILGYSMTKRFTSYTHAFLGIALAVAPMGAWAAVTGSLIAAEPWILAVGVWSWVFGFDLIYSTLDIDFDRKAGLQSFPSRYGIGNSLRLAKALHALTWFALLGFGLQARLGMPYWVALVVVAGALIYEHLLCRGRDVRRINEAFFNMNALVSLVLLIGVLCSVF